ncbi:alpha/beta fold hydrolase [Alteromonas sp. CYL-A6]|uniref:alpha/beta fold hydrolase n=1 Tax=Alteromonas nitratireducens TaxID=3390813 RepID=UPI0034BD00CC
MKKFILCVFLIALLSWLGQIASNLYMSHVYQAPGSYVETEMGSLHLYCVGDKSAPLVVLEAGAIGWSQTWSWIQPALAEKFRVCSYDRPGLGWSEANQTPDAGAAVSALYDALSASGENLSDITMVGHSYGAIVIRAFAAKYPQNVSNLIFVDGSHPDQFSILPESFVQKAQTFNDLLRPLGYLSHTGLVRILNPLGQLADELPDQNHFAVRYFGSNPIHLLTSYTEMQLWPRSAELAKMADLSHKPLLIISAASMPDATEEEYQAWLELHKSMLSLSLYSKHLIIPGSDHYSLLMNPNHAALLTQQISAFITMHQEM